MKTRSLRWRLVASLVTLQVAASLLALLIVLALSAAAGRYVDESGERTVQIIAKALRHAPDGRLGLAQDAEAQWLFDATPGTWFIARDAQGHELQYGDVPPRYRTLVQALDGEARSALDLLDAAGRPAARFERVASAAGPVNLLVRTGAQLTLADKFKLAGVAFLVLVAPIMLITNLVVVIAAPFVMRRGLKGVVATAEQAEQVDIDRLEARLPTANVVSEILPLVDSVNRAFDRLDEGYRRQERFLADAAHELRTPISTVRVQVESLSDDSREKPRLVLAITRLVTMAEQLLDLQRLTHVAAARTEAVDLRALCERVVADQAPMVIMSRCAISVVGRAQVIAPVDAASVERAVANLIQNAMEHGGTQCEIQVRVSEPGTIEVCDSGPGIPENERERVVEPFHRLRPQGRGAGLGLHLVAEVVRLHQGRLTVAASDLGGASFVLQFGAPASADAAVSSASG